MVVHLDCCHEVPPAGKATKGWPNVCCFWIAALVRVAMKAVGICGSDVHYLKVCTHLTLSENEFS
jgi:threonine dehydrogenase-like Zn-dependent dehydrogenase